MLVDNRDQDQCYPDGRRPRSGSFARFESQLSAQRYSLSQTGKRTCYYIYSAIFIYLCKKDDMKIVLLNFITWIITTKHV